MPPQDHNPFHITLQCNTQVFCNADQDIGTVVKLEGT